MQKENTPFLRKLFKSKLLIVAEIIVLVLFSSALTKEIIRKYQVQSEVDELQYELEELGQKNFELSGLIEYFDSESYKEEQARLQLGLQKSGEQVVTVLGDSTALESETVTGPEQLALNNNDNLTNPQRWWGYFFKTTKETSN